MQNKVEIDKQKLSSMCMHEQGTPSQEKKLYLQKEREREREKQLSRSYSYRYKFTQGW
jgi:hypothetical protein